LHAIPFLKIGMTMADFHLFGSEPVLNINENKVQRGPQSTPFSVFQSIGGDIVWA